MKKFLMLLLLLAANLYCQNPLSEGIKFYEERNFSEARSIFLEVLEANPKNAEANYHLGMVYFIEGEDLDEAEEYFQSAVDNDPENAQYHYMLGANFGRQAQRASIFSQLSLASSCKEEFEKAVELDPTHVNARISLIQYLVQAPGIAGGSIEDAREETVELEKYSSYGSKLMLASIEQYEQNYVEAEQAYLHAIALEPENPQAYHPLGYLYMINLDEPDKALEQFKNLAKYGSDSANSFDSLGDGYANKEMYEEALLNYTKALEINNTFEPSVYNVALMNDKLNNTEEAVSWYNKYLELYEDGRYADNAEDRLNGLQ